MKARNRFFIGFFLLIQIIGGFPAESRAEISCGQTITEDTILAADLACPVDSDYAIIIGASNIILDLGGYTLSGYTPGTGVFVNGQEGITIRNGIIDGFNVGVYINESNLVTMESLTVRNLDISDPNHFIFGIAVVGSQNIVVRDSQFEFLTIAHKEAVEIFDSYVDVNNIEVRGGGAGVSFSFLNNVCDPVKSPSNGTVRNSKFSDIYVAGVWIACSSSATIESNIFSGCPDCLLGIQGESPFPGAVTGLIVRKNIIQKTFLGIEFRGISQSRIANNYVFDNRGWGIAMRQSLGCLAPQPGWECFYSTSNVVADNETWGNATDLYHYEESLGNVWKRNTCEWKDGSEIPECTPPQAALVINYSSGKPGSFFTLEGANFPANSTVLISVNGTALGTVPTDPFGDLVFLLNTDQADIGYYMISATVINGTANPSSSVNFVLGSNKRMRSQEGQGTIFYVPGGLTQIIYLPFVLR